MRRGFLIGGIWIMTAIWIITVIFLAKRADGYHTKAIKFDEYCLQVRASISTAISDVFEKPRWREQALERFSMLASDIERCTTRETFTTIREKFSTCRSTADLRCEMEAMTLARDALPFAPSE